ncbi:hypothetical protein TL16_g08656 [Triparma laevis f. inornata]|uniref:SET domain-containing protein n=1 Tax=Triparma laevis f. inornata TaxID=1714386 RepID=A0A9W7B584_9STRA|nr:hypothetical protein TL16_g08656 [Triparma laevis f. inornata]
MSSSLCHTSTSSSSSSPPYVQKTTPKSGESLFYTFPLSAHTEILSDSTFPTPSITSDWVYDYCASYEECDEDEQSLWNDLCMSIPDSHSLIPLITSGCSNYITKTSSYLELEELVTAVKIARCNSFSDRNIHPVVSRVNHSCLPNAIYLPTTMGCKLKTLREVEAGEEITISYLGINVFTSNGVRNSRLLEEKFFTCMCRRCSTPPIENRIPCEKCHPREGGGLTEEVEFEEGEVCYGVVMCEKCGEVFGKESLELRRKIEERAGKALNDEGEETSHRAKQGCVGGLKEPTSLRLVVGTELKRINGGLTLAFSQSFFDHSAISVTASNSYVTAGNSYAPKTPLGSTIVTIRQDIDVIREIHEVCSQILGPRHYSTALTSLTIVDSMCHDFNRVMILGEEL